VTKHRYYSAKCPECEHETRWHISADPYQVIRVATAHLATHPGQQSASELFDRAVLAGTARQHMPQA
jgi:hypothetical protein